MAPATLTQITHLPVGRQVRIENHGTPIKNKHFVKSNLFQAKSLQISCIFISLTLATAMLF